MFGSKAVFLLALFLQLLEAGGLLLKFGGCSREARGSVWTKPVAGSGLVLTCSILAVKGSSASWPQRYLRGASGEGSPYLLPVGVGEGRGVEGLWDMGVQACPMRGLVCQ